MKTIVMTAYAINPYKGSEDGMGWNFVLQAARFNKVIAITRRNNREAIEKFQSENPDDRYQVIDFQYFDFPKWMIFWKKGPLLSLIYYYFWQIGVALIIRSKNWNFDIAHNVNFHNDWTPTFLWITGKPLVWGPVGHHPKIDSVHLKFYGFKAQLMDGFLWALKKMFWNFDPFLKLSRAKANHILCMNEEAAEVLNLNKNQYSICPSVATDDLGNEKTVNEEFIVLSAGRFVPLKGFDITLEAFANFYNELRIEKRKGVKLHLVGSGPYAKDLKELANTLGISEAVVWTNWIARNDLLKLYSSASVFLFPSFEGAGMVVAEAMASGLPVLCWRNAGPGAFVPEESKLTVATYLERNQAINSFSARLKLLFDNPSFLAEESKMAKARYLSNFAWDARGDLLKKIYQKVDLAQEKSTVKVKETINIINHFQYANL